MRPADKSQSKALVIIGRLVALAANASRSAALGDAQSAPRSLAAAERSAGHSACSRKGVGDAKYLVRQE